jgi:hypothetical protein
VFEKASGLLLAYIDDMFSTLNPEEPEDQRQRQTALPQVARWHQTDSLPVIQVFLSLALSSSAPKVFCRTLSVSNTTTFLLFK